MLQLIKMNNLGTDRVKYNTAAKKEKKILPTKICQYSGCQEKVSLQLRNTNLLDKQSQI
jgi:hypothetical protein